MKSAYQKPPELEVRQLEVLMKDAWVIRCKTTGKYRGGRMSYRNDGSFKQARLFNRLSDAKNSITGRADSYDVLKVEVTCREPF